MNISCILFVRTTKRTI